MGRYSCRYPDTWATPIWPTDTWPTDIWSTDTWPTDIWPISAWGDIWPTDKMSHFNNSFIQFNNRISSIQRAVSDGNITKMWKESKEKFGQNCLLAKCPPMHLLAKCPLAGARTYAHLTNAHPTNAHRTNAHWTNAHTSSNICVNCSQIIRLSLE